MVPGLGYAKIHMPAHMNWLKFTVDWVITYTATACKT